MDLLSAAQKQFCRDQLDNVFDTFCENILIFKVGETTILSSNPEEFNFIYANNQPSVTTSYSPISGIFPGSINWGNPATWDEREIRPAIDGQLCQVDLRISGYNFLSGYQSVIINNIQCEVSPEHNAARPHAIFEPTYFCVTFRRVN